MHIIGTTWKASSGTSPRIRPGCSREACRLRAGARRGLDEIRAMAHRRFRTIPDMYWHIRSHWVGGNRGCSEWTVTGTETNGNKINWLGIDVWELNDDGKVVTKDTYWKFAGDEAPE